MKVITVDDSSTMRRIIKNTLNAIGFDDVVEAENGEDALSKLEGVELIITDWNMPVMDGLAFTKEVRANPKMASVPIVMVTTEAGKNEVVDAIKSGVTTYIVKPFTAETLKEKLDSVLQQQS